MTRSFLVVVVQLDAAVDYIARGICIQPSDQCGDDACNFVLSHPPSLPNSG